MSKFDVFISHASEDKEAVVLPLAAMLRKMGLKVWLDSHQLTVGDSLRQSIDRGLSQSRFGVVVISKAFLSKKWPMRELDALMVKEEKYAKVILPVWHGVDLADLEQHVPTIAGKLAVVTSHGVETVARELKRSIVYSTQPEGTWPLYIECLTDPDSGRVSINYQITAKEVDEIDTTIFESRAKPLWRSVRSYTEAIFGLSKDSLTWSRVQNRAFLYGNPPNSKGFRPGMVELERTLIGLPLIWGRWKQLRVMVFLGDPENYFSSNHIGNNRFDIFIVPHRDFEWERDVPKAEDEESRLAVLALLMSSKSELEQLLGSILNEHQFRVKIADPVWEKDSMPMHGSDCFYAPGLLIEDGEDG